MKKEYLKLNGSILLVLDGSLHQATPPPASPSLVCSKLLFSAQVQMVAIVLNVFHARLSFSQLKVLNFLSIMHVETKRHTASIN